MSPPLTSKSSPLTPLSLNSDLSEFPNHLPEPHSDLPESPNHLPEPPSDIPKASFRLPKPQFDVPEPPTDLHEPPTNIHVHEPPTDSPEPQLIFLQTEYLSKAPSDDAWAPSDLLRLQITSWFPN